MELLIPIMIFGIPLLAIWTHHVRKMKTMDAKANPKNEKELDNLRERIEVLERIVTEGDQTLARKFKELE